MSAPWQNADGLQVPFGNYWNDQYNFVNKPRSVKTFGPERILQIDYDLTRIAAGAVGYTADLNNDGTLDGFSLEDVGLPANASVTKVVILPKIAAAGGTSIKLGTFLIDGTAVDDDFLITTTEGAKANLDTVGARTYGNGAGVATTAETAGVGTSDVYLALTVAGTFTAGTGKIYVHYYTTV